MERLTKKEDIYLKSDKECEYNLTSSNDGITILKGDPIEIMSLDKATEKLHKILEIEDKLGIDLITLFNAYSNGFYVKGEKEKQHIDLQNCLNANAFKHKEMFYGHEYCYQYVKLYEYGVTWSMTKEDLEQ